MKKVLYISNIEVPYRVRFFNQLAENCELTVLYERENSKNRVEAWAKSEKHNYQIKYLKGIRIRNESTFSFGILKELFADYDIIVVGCYNSPVQMLAILTMRVFQIPYILNLDGEIFFSEQGFKNKLKRFFLAGAERYMVAGEKAAESLKPVAGGREIIPYYFSSLSRQEVEEHGLAANFNDRKQSILVVGQYFDYKGMDVALETARRNLSLTYKFVGMGYRTEQFLKDQTIPENVEILPFLQKQELEKEYKDCAMMILPSRQECWGLVINEAASFGTPIVSTWGSGAAVEFLADKWPQYLAKPGDPESLYQCIRTLMESPNKKEYAEYLVEMSQKYSIEVGVEAHLRVFEKDN